MAALEFEPDCQRCDGLCCVAAGFEKSDKFAFTKPAGTPCWNLSAEGRCEVYDLLAESGLAGCVEYTCFGAGQNLMQNHFPDASWRDGPAAADEIFRAFYALKELHELIFVLRQLVELSPEARLDRRIEERVAELEALARGEGPPIADVDVDALRRANQDLVKGVEVARNN